MSGRNTAEELPLEGDLKPRKRTIDRVIHVLEEMMFTAEMEAVEVTIVEDPSEAPTEVVESPLLQRKKI